MISKNDEPMLWLAHVSKDFLLNWKSLLEAIGGKNVNPLGHNFYSVKFENLPTKVDLWSTIFSRYWMPVQYMWPTKSEEKGYIEKCAQGIAAKFNSESFFNIVVFSLDRKQQKLASNLRGRILQVLSDKLIKSTSKKLLSEWTKHPNTQPPQNNTLIVAVSEKCTWAGVSSPAKAGCYFAGGRRYVGISSENTASRAAAKFVEATETLSLHGIPIDNAKKWLELGAAPGGVTSELVKRKCEIWAVDKAELDKEISHNPLVHYHKMDAFDFNSKVTFDAIFCDMNGPANNSAKICSKKSVFLKKDGIIIHTLKVHDIKLFDEDFNNALFLFKNSNCDLLYARHLYNNKQEITLFLQKK